MAVQFQLPPELETALRQELTDLDGAAKEALLIDRYRRGKLTHFALGQALNLDRFQVESLLHMHNVTEDLGTAADVLEEVRAIEQHRLSRR